jgi:hypothetical protein
MDPFTLAMMAFSAVKSGVSAYKEIKSTGGEVVHIVNELSGALGSFFDHQDNVVKQAEERKKNPPRGKSIQSIALENVLQKKQLEQAEYDLRQMLVYESPPELGAVWTEFSAERDRLMKEKAKLDVKLKKKKRLTKEEDRNNWRDGSLELQSVLRSWWYPLSLQA